MIGPRLPALRVPHPFRRGHTRDHLNHLLEVRVAVEQHQAVTTRETVHGAWDGCAWYGHASPGNRFGKPFPNFGNIS